LFPIISVIPTSLFLKRKFKKKKKKKKNLKKKKKKKKKVKRLNLTLIQSDTNQIEPEFHGSTIKFSRVSPLKRGEKQWTINKHNHDKNKETIKQMKRETRNNI